MTPEKVDQTPEIRQYETQVNHGHEYPQVCGERGSGQQASRGQQGLHHSQKPET